MNDDVPNLTDLDFYGLSKIPPAFTGVLVDWSIGAREITATFLDLIVRGYIDVVGNLLIKNDRKTKKEFERLFINRIFADKPSLKFDEVANIAYKSAFKDLLKIICDGMIAENVVDKDFQAKLVKYSKEVIKEFKREMGTVVTSSVSPEIDNQKVDPNKPIIILPKWALPVFIALLVTIAIFVPDLRKTIFFLLFMILTPLLMIWRIARKKKCCLGEGIDWILTENGKNIKNKSIDLKKYMEKYPLFEDRLANELVGHAVAFGIGKQWMKKLGKNNAPIALFFENISTQNETTENFMDMQKYVEDCIEAVNEK